MPGDLRVRSVRCGRAENRAGRDGRDGDDEPRYVLLHDVLSCKQGGGSVSKIKFLVLPLYRCFPRPEPVDPARIGRRVVRQEGQQAARAVRRPGIPLAVGVSAANVDDTHALQPLMKGIPAIRSRRRPRRGIPGRLRADQAYCSAAHRAWLRERGIVQRGSGRADRRA
ncbi:transposase [Streptomyces sp. NPDC001606]